MQQENRRVRGEPANEQTIAHLFRILRRGEQLDSGAFPAKSIVNFRSASVVAIDNHICSPTWIRMKGQHPKDSERTAMPLVLPEGNYLTTQEACNILQLSRTSLYVMRQERRGPPSIRWGRRRLYERDAMLKWYADRVASAIEEQ